MVFFFRAHGKSFCALCSKCVETKNVKPCTCKEEEKPFISCWTLPELEKAVEYGSTIENIFEVMAYFSEDQILKEFLDLLSSFKIRHSKFLEEDRDKLQLICDKINEDMNFTDDIVKLTPEKLVFDESAKNFYKLWANALLGKFSQSNDRVSTHVLASQQELDDWVNNSNYVLKDILTMGNIAQITVQRKSDQIPPNMTAQVVIGSYVTGALF